VHVEADASDSNGQSQSRGNGQNGGAADDKAGLFYKAIVKLDEQALQAQGKQFRILPGMQVVAEIDQGRRTVMEYILSPISKVLYDSGHER
jgi:membrane fusion protein, hemolysin D